MYHHFTGRGRQMVALAGAWGPLMDIVLGWDKTSLYRGISNWVMTWKGSGVPILVWSE